MKSHPAEATDELGHRAPLVDRLLDGLGQGENLAVLERVGGDQPGLALHDLLGVVAHQRALTPGVRGGVVLQGSTKVRDLPGVVADTLHHLHEHRGRADVGVGVAHGEQHVDDGVERVDLLCRVRLDDVEPVVLVAPATIRRREVRHHVGQAVLVRHRDAMLAELLDPDAHVGAHADHVEEHRQDDVGVDECLLVLAGRLDRAEHLVGHTVGRNGNANGVHGITSLGVNFQSMSILYHSSP